ncbi:MAG: ArsR/SmtB family transcription factor [Gammaproteobacteria bacterium]
MSLNLDQQVGVLKAAADPSRLRLLNICQNGEFTVTELTRILGQSQPRVSRHLRTLCNAGLLMRFRERHFVFYRVSADAEQRQSVQMLLAGLSATDPSVLKDLEVLARVQDARDERARAVLASVEADQIAPGFPPQLATHLRNCLNLDALGDLLDVGTGSGRVLQLLGPHADSAVGVDISSDSLTVARSNLGAAGLSDVMVRHGDMYRLPYEEDAFDTVTLDNVLSHASAPRDALAEAARTLRPGGVLLVIEARRTAQAQTVSENILQGWASSAALAVHRTEHLTHDEMQLDLHFIGTHVDVAAA